MAIRSVDPRRRHTTFTYMKATIHLRAVMGPRQDYRILSRQEEREVEGQEEPSSAVWALRRSWLERGLQGILGLDK